MKALLVVCVALVLVASAEAKPIKFGKGGVEVTRFETGLRKPTARSGCAGIDVARIGKSILGFTVYKFHHVKGWCWKNGKVTRVDMSTYVSDVDANLRYKGELPKSDGYSPKGHWSRRQGSFENCIFKYGCLGAEYPWVRIEVYGNGTVSWRTGK